VSKDNSRQEFSDQVFYKPWVGRHFGENRSGLVPGNDVRLLVLGESHYGQFEEPHRASIELIECCAIHDAGHAGRRYITQAGQALAGKHRSEIGDEGFAALWQDVAFYNYIQVGEIEGPRESPADDAFSQSFSAFEEVVTTLRPTHIWVHGHRLWDQLPYTSYCPRPNPEFSGKPVRNGIYKFDNLLALAFATYHPSAGFSMDRWHEVIEHFLAKRAD